jgi:K+-sensing histidine kinase KdpD
MALPVALSGLLFGLDCGLASAVCAAALNYVIFVPPSYTLVAYDWRDPARVIVFLAVGLFAALALDAVVQRTKVRA